jgi:hypothetical protein
MRPYPRAKPKSKPNFLVDLLGVVLFVLWLWAMHYQATDRSGIPFITRLMELF